MDCQEVDMLGDPIIIISRTAVLLWLFR